MISHIQLFLAALAFAVLAPLPLAHAQNAVPWFHGVLPMGTDVPPHLLQGGVSGDFDGDGTEDIMCLESKQMNIAWNSFEGLAPFRPLPFPNGELRGGLGMLNPEPFGLSLPTPSALKPGPFKEPRLGPPNPSPWMHGRGT